MKTRTALHSQDTLWIRNTFGKTVPAPTSPKTCLDGPELREVARCLARLSPCEEVRKEQAVGD